MSLFQRDRRWRSQKPRRVVEARSVQTRLLAFGVIVIAAFGLLAWQLWNLQIINGVTYAQRAEGNRLRIEYVAAPRGIIYDRNGNQLVANAPSFTISVTPSDLPRDQDRLDAVLARLERLTDKKHDEVVGAVTAARSSGQMFSRVPIVTNASSDMALAVQENLFQLPGVRVETGSARRYAEGDSLVHILGYIGRISANEYRNLREQGYQLNDRLGKSGVELIEEAALRGRLGRETVEYNASGDKVQVLGREEPIPGNSVVLSIDMQLQAKMKDVLEKSRKNSEQSVGIAMDPRSGEILAMVSLPGYDNNFFSRPIDDGQLQRLINDPRRPLINHAVASAFPPGSIFKIIVGAAALQEGIATPSTVITSTGSITIANQFDASQPGYVFKDWAALGALDFRRAMAMSSDVYFYYLAGGFREPGGRDFKGLGPTRIANYAKNFGLGRPTGIDLPNEANGNVPSPEQLLRTFNQTWVLGDTYNMGIGQGYVTTTPMQMVNATAAVANGGTLWSPQVVREIRDAEGRVVQPFTRKAQSTIEISPQHLQVVREGMRLAVTAGTVAQLGRASGVDSAGKTGTAEYTARDATGYGKTHGWYVGYAPYENPEIAFIIFQQSGAGSDDAAPPAMEFLKFWNEYRKTNATLRASSATP